VLTPHPDDETIMCGATIAALARRGDHVRVIGVTTGAATAVGLSVGPSSEGPAAADIGQTRAAELRAACRALGVDDVAVWDFVDGAVTAERSRLAARIAAELDAVRPALVVVPFPFDAHADHVAVALGLADALATRSRSDEPGVSSAADLLRVAAGAVQTPLSADWATRLVLAGSTWAARQAAVAAHVSRGPSVFSTSTRLSRLHPARPLRRVEAFAELSPSGFVGLARAMEAEGLTKPCVRTGGHALSVATKLRRTRTQRDRIRVLLRAAVASRAGDDPRARAD
jgi:LmbE family N-acetylglucosaminyl deacetylase